MRTLFLGGLGPQGRAEGRHSEIQLREGGREGSFGRWLLSSLSRSRVDLSLRWFRDLGAEEDWMGGWVDVTIEWDLI